MAVMPSIDQTDKWFDMAVKYEAEFVAGNEAKKKAANMAFRRAMILDGNTTYTEDIL